MTCHPYNIADRRCDGVRGLSRPEGKSAGLPWLLLQVVSFLLIGASSPGQCPCAVPGPTYLLGDGFLPAPANRPLTTQVLSPVWNKTDVLTGQQVDTAILGDLPGELRLTVPETFLNRLLARCDVDRGPVTDQILGADVTGEQQTKSCLAVDLQPHNAAIRLSLELTGTTVNQTVGVTPQAAVRSRGQHDFRLTKQIDFDGQLFTTRSPAAWVTPRLQNEGARTSFAGVPLIGPISNQIALTEANRQRPLAEQIITQRVTEQAAPRFNREVDEHLAAANQQLQQIGPQWLLRLGLTPQSLSLRTTDDRILVGVCVADQQSGTGTPIVLPTPTETPRTYRDPGDDQNPQQPGTDQPDRHSTDRPLLPAPESSDPSDPPAEVDDDGFTIIRQISDRQISPPLRPSLQPDEHRSMRPPPAVVEGAAFSIAVNERFVNYLLNRLPIGQMEVPDRTIDRLLEILRELISGEGIPAATFNRLGQETPEFSTIVLSGENPLTFTFEDGQILISAIAAFRPMGSVEVPPQRIDIPLSLSMDDDGLTLTPGDVSVSTLPGTEAGPLMQLSRPIIRQQVAARLQPISLPVTLSVGATDSAPFQLSVRQVTIADGWILIAVD